MFLLFNRLRHSHIDPHKIIWIHPRDVVYKRTVHLWSKRGKVKGGDWDLNCTLFDDYSTYRGMRERYVEGKEWKDTDFYKEFAKRIEDGEVRWRCTTIEEFDSYLANIDTLFEDIKENGYRLQSDPKTVEVYDSKHDPLYQQFDEVSVSIARDGSLLFADGAHRLSIAKILGLEYIPALVVMRHSCMMRFRAEIEAFAEASPGGKLYQKAYHPDLADIPYARKEDRWPAIRDTIETTEGKVLDIGANFGLFCYKLERAHGLECTAVEINPQEVYLGKKMRDAVGAEFDFKTRSIFDLDEEEVKQYDVVLALSIFHHFIKRKSEYEKLVAFLRKLGCREMFLETHSPEESQMKQAYKNFAPDEFVRFIIDNTTLEKAETVFEATNGRVLYRLTT
jgi:2-polyprenyl-3-methyl-5-hydroxy-6-metoxy-1,4-benzoquinol methylase